MIKNIANYFIRSQYDSMSHWNKVYAIFIHKVHIVQIDSINNTSYILSDVDYEAIL